MSAPQPTLPFADVLDAADRLTVDEQEELTAIIRRRLAERGRQRVVREVAEARAEFAAGGCQPTSAADLLGEILS